MNFNDMTNDEQEAEIAKQIAQESRMTDAIIEWFCDEDDDCQLSDAYRFWADHIEKAVEERRNSAHEEQK